MRIFFGGHASALVEIDGVRVLTDPLFRSNLLHLQRHAPPIDLAEFTRADLLLISHAHLDHLDRRSLNLLHKAIPAIVPNDSVRIMRNLGFRDVTGVSVGDSLDVAGLTVSATPAKHEGKRMPWNSDTEALGFLVEGTQSFYFAGDTDLFDEMATLGSDLDLALLPVWGWGPKLGEGHLNPERAAAAVGLIRPRVAVPIHWGGYLPATMARRRPDLLTDPPREFLRHVEANNLTTRVKIVEPGESLTVERVQSKR